MIGCVSGLSPPSSQITEQPRELIKKGNNEISKLEELTIEDVKKAIRNLKNNKAPGTDGIHLELIKYVGNKLLNRMYELVRQIWEEERRQAHANFVMNLQFP